MITCFRPPGFRRDWFSRYCHLWRKQAGVRKEALVQSELDDDSIAHAWDRINITPGRAIIWASPAFIPHPSFFDEIDYYLDEQKRIIGIREYEGVFQPRADVPHVWQEVGLAKFPLIFQLTGQRSVTLPRYAALRKGPWHWLGLTQNRFVVLLEQHFVGDRHVPLSRSNLGVIYPQFWGSGECCQSGRLIFGSSRNAQKERLREAWLERLEAWETWLNVKIDPKRPTRNTMYSSQSFVSEDQDGSRPPSTCC